MKKNLIVLMTVVAASMTTIAASAQQGLKLELGYNVGIPMGSFKNDFINKTSFSGGYGQLSYSVSPKFSLGLQSGFQSYYQKYDRKVYKLDGNQTVSAVVSNTLDIVPLLLRGTFFPMGTAANAKVQPYVSAAAGISMVNYGQYLGEFGGTEAASPFTAQAGAGISIPLNSYSQTAIKIGATYNYINYNRNEINKLNNVGVNAGVVFALR